MGSDPVRGLVVLFWDLRRIENTFLFFAFQHQSPPIEVVFLRLEIPHMHEIVKRLVERLVANLREAFEERAALMEFEGGLERDHAEALALLDLIRMDPAAVFACWQ